MFSDSSHPARFGIAWAVLGLSTVAAVVATVKVLTLPPLAHLAHKSDLGDQNLIALCESGITASVQQAYGQVKGYSNPKVAIVGDNATVKVTLKSSVFTGRLACTFRRSVWQATGIAQA